MKVKDVMTRAVVSVAPETPVLEAIARMTSERVSGMPVIDADGRLVGMVTEGDFLRRVETGTEAPRRRWLELLLGPGSPADEYARSHGRRVEDVMSSDVISVSPEARLSDVVHLMEEHAIKRLPVTERGQIVGIVSRADLMIAVAKRYSERKRVPADDDTIRNGILTEMSRQTWCPRSCIKVVVRNGFVELSGTIFDERQRRALRVLVERFEGVKRVHDDLTLAEPVK